MAFKIVALGFAALAAHFYALGNNEAISIMFMLPAAAAAVIFFLNDSD